MPSLEIIHTNANPYAKKELGLENSQLYKEGSHNMAYQVTPEVV